MWYMAIPAETVHVQFRGHLPGSEEWQWGFWLAGTNITSEADANALANDVVGAFAVEAQATVAGLMDPLAGIDEVRTYCYPTGGPTALYIGSADYNIVGTGASSSRLPLQAALVVSLRTGFAGRRARGRLYLPCHRIALGTDYQLSNTTTDVVADDMSDFFTNLNALTGVGTVSVVSQVGAGQARAVTSVIVDSRIDIQRRRAGDQVPTVTSTQPVAI